LELRNPLAGDVAVHILDGNLVLDGDADGNQIAIASGERHGQFYVAGLTTPNGDTTTVNGMTGRVLFEGIQRNIRANLGEGNDRVLVGRLRTSGNVALAMGPGDDRVAVGHTPDPTQPTPRLDVAIRGSLIVELGEGNDDLAVRDAHVAEGLFAAGGLGEDGMRFEQVTAARGITVRGDAGNDMIATARVRGHALHVLGGAGDDRVAVVGTALGNLAVDLGAGNDALLIANNSATGRVVLNGGDGEDTLVNHGRNRWRDPVVVSFEL
jgi:hypothetical protein